MCKIIDDIVQRERKEAAQEAEKQTEKKVRTETAYRLIAKDKYAVEEIAEMSGLSVDEVKELMQKHSA